ncbi:FecR family protein [Pseudovibrio ascidiaceicola]|uniref:FecR family protein n=1 Tax=Pseudovibrio ascidiaceicola TaxID=285279 RepID=UPI000D69FD96|nr:FecR domain-containing protein [Pseudovibrio ascidiaceicola]
MTLADFNNEIPSSAEDAAISWFILLEEYPEDLKLWEEFDDWFLQDLTHQEAWLKVSQTSEVLGQLELSSTEQGSKQARAVEPAFATQNFFARSKMAFAAGFSFLLLLCIGLTVPQHLVVWFYADHKTEVAQTKEVELEDGSTIYLSAYSAIDLDFTDEERKVSLLRGEALFNVVRDKERPFVVTSGDTTTKVLGTRFNVNKGLSTVSVGVEHGHVQVAGNPDVNEVIELRDADWARVHEDGHPDIRSRNAEYIAAWQRGKLYIDDQSFEEVLFLLRRFMKTPVLVLDPRLNSKRVTGVFDLSKPRQSLNAIVAAHAAKLRDFDFFITISKI